MKSAANDDGLRVNIQSIADVGGLRENWPSGDRVLFNRLA